MLQEELDDLEVALVASPIQWSVSILVCRVLVGAVVEEEPQHLEMAIEHARLMRGTTGCIHRCLPSPCQHHGRAAASPPRDGPDRMRGAAACVQRHCAAASRTPRLALLYWRRRRYREVFKPQRNTHRSTRESDPVFLARGGPGRADGLKKCR